MDMKNLAISIFISFLLIWSGNLNAQERKKAEICLAGGAFLSEDTSTAFVAASIGYKFKFIGAEVNGEIFREAIVLGTNLLLGPFHLRIIPYATGGIWTTTWGGIGLNVGGGIKIKLSDTFAVRAEFRRYFVESDWGINTIIGGISLFF